MTICYHGKAKVIKQRLGRSKNCRDIAVVVSCECGYGSIMVLPPVPWNGLTVIKKRI